VTTTASTPGAPPAADPGNTADLQSAAGLSARQRWRRHRVLVGVALAVVAGAVVVSLVNSTEHADTLDPRSYDSNGAHAIGALLAARGVHVTTYTSTASAVSAAVAGSTLVVVDPERLSDADAGELAGTAADLLIVGADPLQLQQIGLPVAPGEPGSSDKTVEPECRLAAATTAGSAYVGVQSYRSNNATAACYPVGDGSALLQLAGPRGNVATLLADGTPLLNANLARAGDAALALGLLDAHPQVEWLVPPIVVAGDTTASQPTLVGLMPARLKWAALQLLVAVAVVAVWRGRRFGRLVPEALPVVVRQAETAIGRGRLYRRARARPHAAESLREATRARLRRRLGLPASVPVTALVAAVASRTGRAATDVHDVLYGSIPSDDRGLVALAGELSRLERQARQR
jgi:hypothetical protein